MEDTMVLTMGAFCKVAIHRMESRVVVQKMRIDLACRILNPSPISVSLFQCFFDQLIDSFHHFIEGRRQFADLILVLDIHSHGQISLFNLFHAVGQRNNGLCNAIGERIG